MNDRPKREVLNPNAKVKEAKRRYGQNYDYSFMEYDKMQRDYFYELQAREKRRGKHEKSM